MTEEPCTFTGGWGQLNVGNGEHLFLVRQSWWKLFQDSNSFKLHILEIYYQEWNHYYIKPSGFKCTFSVARRTITVRVKPCLFLLKFSNFLCPRCPWCYVDNKSE